MDVKETAYQCHDKKSKHKTTLLHVTDKYFK